MCDLFRAFVSTLLVIDICHIVYAPLLLGDGAAMVLRYVICGGIERG
jgi:hypothetical protein